MFHHDMWILTCVLNFSSVAWIEVCQEPPFLEVILGGHWWFLTGVFGHLWYHRSSWQTMMKLSWKFCEDLTSFGWDIVRLTFQLFGLLTYLLTHSHMRDLEGPSPLKIVYRCYKNKSTFYNWKYLRNPTQRLCTQLYTREIFKSTFNY